MKQFKQQNNDLVSYGASAGLIGMAALVGLPVGGACAYLLYTLYRDKKKNN